MQDLLLLVRGAQGPVHLIRKGLWPVLALPLLAGTIAGPAQGHRGRPGQGLTAFAQINPPPAAG